MAKPMHSLCWDCKCSTTKGCSWASDFKPVKGWKAEKRIIKGTHSTPNTVSYRVDYCPQFNRDSFGGGLRRTGGKRHELTLQGL